MSRGKGTGSSFRPRCRGITAPAKPVMTRLTRMMGFVELPQAPPAPGVPDEAGEDFESTNPFRAVH